MALELPGTLAVTQTTLASMNTDLSGETIALQQATAARDLTYTTQNRSAFIKVTMNINDSVSYFPSDSDLGEDDAWSLSAIQRTNLTIESGETVTYSLPSASNIAVDGGSVVVSSDGASGTFSVTCTMSLSDQGVITCSTAISGSDVTGTKDENNKLAQTVYWPINDGTNDYSSSGSPPAAPDADTGVDTLSATLTAANLNTHYLTELAAITAQYNNVNVVSSWQLDVTAMAQSTNSVLSNYARDNNKTTTVFGQGDEVVTSGGHSYAVSVTDAEGVATTIRAATDVYGILQQS